MNQEENRKAARQAQIELAEAAAADRREERQFMAMTRESLDQVDKRLTGMNAVSLARFHQWLEAETRLDESCNSFAAIVLAMCMEEVTRRFLGIYGLKGGAE